MPAPDPKPLLVCTVSDGVDSVLRVAEYLATLDRPVQRTDLQLAQARERLVAHSGDDFDLLIVAPGGAPGTAPLAAQAVLDAGLDRSARQVVLLDGPKAIAPKGGPTTEILRGAAFVPDVPPTAKKPRFALFRRKVQPAPPAPEPVAVPQIIGVHGMSGGAGATVLAVNLATELARDCKVCLIDLDLQFGTAASYLDLPPEPKILNAYRDMNALDADAFNACLQWQGKLAVFSAPPEVLPLDALSARSAEVLLHRARQMADMVVINLPLATTDWTETVYVECDRIYAVSTPDVRSAQNARRMLALMRSASLSEGKVHHVLNRVPHRPGKLWAQQRESFEKGIGRPFSVQLPDCGPEIAAACDAGSPLSTAAPKSPLLTAIRDLAGTLRRPVEV